MLRVNFFGFIIFLFLLFTSASSFALGVDEAANPTIAYHSFLQEISVLINDLIDPGSTLGGFLNTLILAFSVGRLVITVSKWMFYGASDIDLIYSVILVLLVTLIFEFFGFLTLMIIKAGEGISLAIQEEALGSSEAFYAYDYITSVRHNIVYGDATIWDGIIKIASIVTFFFLSLALGVISFFIEAWVHWGLALARLVGLIFVPFLLVEKLVPLFDQWFRFFLGFVFYGILAKINLVLVAILLSKLFGIGLSIVGSALVIPSDIIDELLGLVSIIVIAIVSLLSTGKWSIGLMGGVGGFGGGIIGIAALAASRFKK